MLDLKKKKVQLLGKEQIRGDIVCDTLAEFIDGFKDKGLRNVHVFTGHVRFYIGECLHTAVITRNYFIVTAGILHPKQRVIVYIQKSER